MYLKTLAEKLQTNNQRTYIWNIVRNNSKNNIIIGYYYKDPPPNKKGLIYFCVKLNKYFWKTPTTLNWNPFTFLQHNCNILWVYSWFPIPPVFTIWNLITLELNFALLITSQIQKNIIKVLLFEQQTHKEY